MPEKVLLFVVCVIWDLALSKCLCCSLWGMAGRDGTPGAAGNDGRTVSSQSIVYFAFFKFLKFLNCGVFFILNACLK